MDITLFLFALLIIGLLCMVLLLVLVARGRQADGTKLVKELAAFEKQMTLFDARLNQFETGMKDEFLRNRRESADSSAKARAELSDSLSKFQASVNAQLSSMTKTTQVTITTNLSSFLQTVQQSLTAMQNSNEKKLEQMRVTVDEKLQSTLEKRLSGSFQLVTKQLEAVSKGLGEMQALAGDVGGLKRALTNVKTAGNLGEVQLEALLSQILTTDQYEKNAHPNPSKLNNVVEFAVRIPSKTADGAFVLLPVDSKYPATAWDKLTQAYEMADKEQIEALKKALATEIRSMAKDIRDKYISVPYTTDFGIMFLPFEGLFAEVMRMPGLFQQIQDEYRVTITGPTTLGAFLNSLQMGFRTLAIQKETSKVWELLGTVKTEFGKFGDVLAATKKKLESAAGEIEKAETRSRVIQRKLTHVDAIASDEYEGIS
ncbi:MAG: DNA recombination protein RmuC [Treponema sp.]|nr:DNA recombination protein RmuC [Candidatus Treponema caballi]